MNSYAERRKQALREEIIDTAFDVFAERGYHDTGIADIATRVGIGNSTFYRQFGSKREILDAVITAVVERITATLAADNAPRAATSLADYRDQVRRIATGLDSICEDPRLVRLLLVQAAGVDAELEQRVFGIFELAVTMTASYLEHGRNCGYLDPGLDTAATAEALVGMILGTALLGLRPRSVTTRGAVVDAAIAVMFDGISDRHGD